MNSISFLFLVCSMVLLFLDVMLKKVPNIIVALLFVAISEHHLNSGIFLQSLGNGVIAFVIFVIIYIFSKEGIGGGDIKYTSLTSYCFGYQFWLNSLLISSITALTILIPLIILGKIDKQSKIPFIPFLVVGVIITFITDLKG